MYAIRSYYDQEDDGRVPAFERQYGDRHPGQRADHAQELEGDVGDLQGDADIAHGDPDRQADRDTPDQPDQDAVQAGADRRPDIAAGHQVVQRLERRCRSEGGEGAEVIVVLDDIAAVV